MIERNTRQCCTATHSFQIKSIHTTHSSTFLWHKYYFLEYSNIYKRQKKGFGWYAYPTDLWTLVIKLYVLVPFIINCNTFDYYK